MKLFTIGFKGRSASDFFTTLKKNGIQKLIDVRRKNISQLSGFTKGLDLKFFLEECFGISYEHRPDFGPSEELLDNYRKQLGSKKKDAAAWFFYVSQFQKEVLSQPITEQFQKSTENYDCVCLLCSEEKTDYCHRRLLAEHFKNHLTNIEIYHL